MLDDENDLWSGNIRGRSAIEFRLDRKIFVVERSDTLERYKRSFFKT